MFGLFFALIPGILKNTLKTYSLGCRRFSLLKCGFFLVPHQKKFGSVTLAISTKLKIVVIILKVFTKKACLCK